MDTTQVYKHFLDGIDIAKEVDQHGFYIAYVKRLVNNNLGDKAAERTIKKMAVKAHLKVSFNHELGLCIFER